MRYLLAIILTVFLAAPAYAAFQGPSGNQMGGFQGPGAMGGPTTVRQAKNMRDDTKVVLVGQIIEQMPYDDDKYKFRDNTGEIIVEIDDEDFRGQNVTPANTVRIMGEVDKEMMRAPEIDVKWLEVIK